MGRERWPMSVRLHHRSSFYIRGKHISQLTKTAEVCSLRVHRNEHAETLPRLFFRRMDDTMQFFQDQNVTVSVDRQRTYTVLVEVFWSDAVTPNTTGRRKRRSVYASSRK